MRVIVIVFFTLVISTPSHSQNLEKHGKDPCSLCIINANAKDSLNYLYKIDSLSAVIKQSKSKLSSEYCLIGRYYICLLEKSYYRDSNIYAKPAIDNLTIAIENDAKNWLAYRGLVDYYFHYIPTAKNEMDSAYKYCNLLIKANDTIGDSYLKRAFLSILLNDTKYTLQDLNFARHYHTCNDSTLIEAYESLYYLLKCDFIKFYDIYESSSFLYFSEFYYYFIPMTMFESFPFIKNSLIEFLKQDKEENTRHRYFKELLLINYRFEKLETIEIEKL